jgi:FixJ family two-component response regulator
MRGGFAAFFEKSVDLNGLQLEIERCLERDSQRMSRLLSQANYASRLSQLSVQERRTLTCLANGMLNKQIADQLGVSERSVETYRKRMMQKLGIDTLADLVYFAVACGIRKLPHESSDP